MIDLQILIHTYGKSIGETINAYVEKRYSRWLDYSAFHCSRAGIPDESVDILNTVMLDLLQKEPETLKRLYSTTKKSYRELDFYVLRMVKLNVSSPTSPYQHQHAFRKYRIDTDVRWDRLKIIDESSDEEEVDKAKIMLRQFRHVAWVAKGLDLTELERKVFNHKFINNNSFSEWTGPETYRQIYVAYHHVIGIIHSILYLKDFTKVPPKGKLSDRQSELADRFVRTHRIQKNKHSNKILNT